MPLDAERTGLLTQAWREIASWCELHAPATAAVLRPPVDESALALAQELTGRPWPVQLLTLLRLVDGADHDRAGFVLPLHVPLGARDIADEWVTWMQVMDEGGGAERRQRDAGDPAGSPTAFFLEPFVPIATDGEGGLLFVDTRPGRLSGSVATFGAQDGAVDDPQWQDIAAMLIDVSGALLQRVQLGHAAPVITDGALGWDVVY